MTDHGKREQARARLREIRQAKDDESEAVLAALDLGVEQQEVAADLRCTRERVRQIVRKARPESGRGTPLQGEGTLGGAPPTPPATMRGVGSMGGRQGEQEKS